MSKIKVNEIEKSSGSGITIPTGTSFTITDGLAVSSLPTVTVAKGGTNLTSFTAGDLLYATGSTTLAKLPKGTAGQVLQMNSGASAPEWAASTGGVNTPAFRAGNNGTTLGSGSAGTYYKIPMDTERFDIGGCYNHTSSTVTLNGISTPSYSFAPNVAGKYMCGCSIRISDGGANSTFFAIRIRKNGNEEIYNGIDQDGAYYPMIQTHGVVELNGTSDYIDAAYYVRNNWYEVYNNTNTTYFYAYKLIE